VSSTVTVGIVFFFQAEDGIRDFHVTGVQTCALPIFDQPLFDGARATKRDLVDYLDAVSGHLLPELSGRPLTVVRVLRGQSPFMRSEERRVGKEGRSRESREH